MHEYDIHTAPSSCISPHRTNFFYHLLSLPCHALSCQLRLGYLVRAIEFIPTLPQSDSESRRSGAEGKHTVSSNLSIHFPNRPHFEFSMLPFSFLFISFHVCLVLSSPHPAFSSFIFHSIPPTLFLDIPLFLPPALVPLRFLLNDLPFILATTDQMTTDDLGLVICFLFPA